jgi:hypothetical protein
MTSVAGPAYVAAVLLFYVDLPDTPLRPSPQDQALARRLQEQDVPLSLVEAALLLASLRRLMRRADLPPLPPIRSLAYFQPVIEELQQQGYPMATWTTFGSSSTVSQRPCRPMFKKDVFW